MTNEELLILGNGFDLSVGLRTEYKDFFRTRYPAKLIESITKHFDDGSDLPVEIKSIENINFWDVFFLLKYIDTKNIDKNWANIEEEIRDFLTYTKIDNNLGKKTLKRIFKSRGEHIYTAVNRFKYSGYAYRLLFFLNKTDNLNETNLDEFLNSELIVFEAAFAKYIKKELEGHKEYKIKSSNLVKALVSDIEETSVITFNYTEIQIENLFSVENVHGTANEEIIFGIDYKDLSYNSEEYKYSKTYRKLLSNVSNNQHQALTPDVKTIKFYGHSLSDADYSYFQSIFDFYSIYNSNVSIEFFFNVYDESIRKNILTNQLSGVTSLLSIYGETMTNENHGKNLIHKLLLENRIRIIEIDSDGKPKNILSTQFK